LLAHPASATPRINKLDTTFIFVSSLNANDLPITDCRPHLVLPDMDLSPMCHGPARIWMSSPVLHGSRCWPSELPHGENARLVKLLGLSCPDFFLLSGNGLRWSRRIAVDIPVEVAAVGSPPHGHLKDPSLSGALLTTDHALPLHAYIEISISPPETRHGAARVMARVTRNLEGGFGIACCEFAPSAVTDLLRSPAF